MCMNNILCTIHRYIIFIVKSQSCSTIIAVMYMENRIEIYINITFIESYIISYCIVLLNNCIYELLTTAKNIMRKNA